MLIMWMPRQQVHLEAPPQPEMTHHRPFVSRHKAAFVYRSFCRQCGIGRPVGAGSPHRLRSELRGVLKTSVKERRRRSIPGPPKVTISHPSAKCNNPRFQRVLACIPARLETLTVGDWSWTSGCSPFAILWMRGDGVNGDFTAVAVILPRLQRLPSMVI